MQSLIDRADTPIPVTDARASFWHIDKTVPLALIVVLLLQTAGGVWWASSVTSEMKTMTESFKEFKAERYTKEDGRRDREFLQLTAQMAVNRDAELSRRLDAVEQEVRNHTRDVQRVRKVDP